jgi:hypothetical protein
MTAKNWTCSKQSKREVIRYAALQTVLHSLRLGDVLIAPIDCFPAQHLWSTRHRAQGMDQSHRWRHRRVPVLIDRARRIR